MAIAATTFFPAPNAESLQGEDLPDASASSFIRRNSGDTAWEVISYAGGNLDTDLSAAAGLPGGRLTLTTLVPVTTADVTTSTSVFYTPYVSNLIQLWNGTAWTTVAFAETTLPLGTVTSGKPYDVFGYLSAGILALESLIWASDTARGTAVTIQDGRYCKSGDHTRLYLGTFYTISTTATADSAAKRLLWNMYNTVERYMLAVDASNSWTYTTDVYRQANAAAANRLEYVAGLADVEVECMVRAIVFPTASVAVTSGIGIDSSTTTSAQIMGTSVEINATLASGSFYRGFPGVGRHTLVWLERSDASGTSTWNGTGGVTIRQAGLCGIILT